MMMMSVTLVAALMMAGSAAAGSCGSWDHAHCNLKWSWPTNSSARCTDVFETIVYNLKSCCLDPAIPAKNTHYKLVSATGSAPTWTIEGQMNWPDGYTDHQTFTLSQPAGGACTVEACSASAAVSFDDFDGNFCDLRNLIRGTPFAGSSLREVVGDDGCRNMPMPDKITSKCNAF